MKSLSVFLVLVFISFNCIAQLPSLDSVSKYVFVFSKDNAENKVSPYGFSFVQERQQKYRGFDGTWYVFGRKNPPSYIQESFVFIKAKSDPMDITYKIMYSSFSNETIKVYRNEVQTDSRYSFVKEYKIGSTYHFVYRRGTMYYDFCSFPSGDDTVYLMEVQFGYFKELDNQ